MKNMSRCPQMSLKPLLFTLYSQPSLPFSVGRKKRAMSSSLDCSHQEGSHRDPQANVDQTGTGTGFRLTSM